MSFWATGTVDAEAVSGTSRYARLRGRDQGIAEQPPASSSSEQKPDRAPSSEQTRLGGSVLGLVLIIGAGTDQAVQLSNQVVPQVPAPRLAGLRVLMAAVGAVLLLWGLAGLLASTFQ